MLHATLSPPMLVDGSPQPALGAVCLNFWPNLTKVWLRTRALAIGVKLQWLDCDKINRFPSTRAALVIQIQWVINICHHL